MEKITHFFPPPFPLLFATFSGTFLEFDTVLTSFCSDFTLLNSIWHEQREKMTQYGLFYSILWMTTLWDVQRTQGQPSVTKTNVENSIRYGNESHWLNIGMPAVSYWDTMGFPAPTDVAVWEMAKKQAMTGQQILLAEVLNTIHSPGDILSGDIKFRRLKKLVDMEVSEKEGGFGKMKQHMQRSGCCHGRSPVTLLGGGEIVKGMMSVKTIVKLLRKHGAQVNSSLPDEGIVALGSTGKESFPSFFLPLLFALSVTFPCNVSLYEPYNHSNA